jgi:hypothetical protein
MNTKKLSITTGLLYLSLVLIGPFIIMVLPETFANASNITTFVESNRPLLSLWLFGDLTIITIELFLTTFLYLLTKQLSKSLSLVAFVARLLMVVVMIVNAFTIAAMHSPFVDQDLLNTLIYIHNSGTYLWQVFFFIHVLILGYLVIKSDHIKTWVGVMLFIGSFGYLFDSIIQLLEIDHAILSTIAMLPLIPVVIGEIAFGVLLLRNKVA